MAENTGNKESDYAKSIDLRFFLKIAVPWILVTYMILAK